jgi:CoA:oxalate CoA-transferase
MSEAEGLPLAGKRVLEIGHMLAGPYCGLLLADLGAEVIKIESGEGDIARSTGPHALGPYNIYFASLNRNKKSVLLDLKGLPGRAHFEELVVSADALITNLRPDAIERLGLTYEALRRLNPRLVCVALTGFGLNGPYRDNPAYDYIIQALCGVMMLSGEPDAPPTRVGYSVVDNTGGMMAAIGLLAQLVSQRGAQIDVSLYDTMLSQLNYLAAAYLNSGLVPHRQRAGGHAYFVPAQIFATVDGYLALFITHDDFWRRFCIATDRNEWVIDARFATMVARAANREHVVDAIADLLRTRSTAAWLNRLQPAGLVVAAVETMAEALGSAHTAAREMVATVTTPYGPLRLVGSAVKIPGVAPHYTAPPLLGEHTAALCSTSNTMTV